MKPARKKLNTGLLTVVAGGLLLGICLFTLRDTSNHDIDALKAKGIPTTREELKNVYLGTGEDAEPYYERFVDRHQHMTHDEQQAELRLMVASALSKSPKDEDAAEKMRDVYKDFIAASQMPAWKIGSSEASTGVWADVVVASETVPCQMAAADAHAGKIDEALKMLQAEEGLYRQLNQNPSFALFSRDKRVIQIYKSMIDEHQGDPKVLEKIITALSVPMPEPDRRYSLAKYIVSDQAMLQNPNKFIHPDPAGSSLDKFQVRWLEPRRVRRVATKDIHIWRLAFDEFPEGPLDWHTAQDTLAALYAENAKGDDAFDDYPSYVSRAIKECSVWGTSDVRRRALLIIAKIYLIRDQTGAWPKTLPGTDAETFNPFTGRAFDYRFRKNGEVSLYYSADTVFFEAPRVH